MSVTPDLEGEISGLYAQALDEFTAARDALAKRLRQSGEREQAEMVKRLRKPTATAWALNRLRHRDGGRIDELLDAGARLREAQRQLLSAGDRDGLRKASARERERVDAVVADAEAELSAAGHASSPAIRSRLFSTLHAAAVDDETRALLAAGRLIRDHEIGDFGFALDASSDPPPQSEPRAVKSRSEPRTAKAQPKPDRRERQLAAARRQLDEAKSTQARRHEETVAAERLLQDAERRAAQAQEQLRQAERQAAEAAAELEAGDAAAREARAREHATDQSVAELETALSRVQEG